jgi:uncharacterized protein (DUF433 family)
MPCCKARSFINPGKPETICVGHDATGTRVPIQTLFDYLEGGETLEDFLEGFPTVTRESAVAALEEAKDLLLSRP